MLLQERESERERKRERGEEKRGRERGGKKERESQIFDLLCCIVVLQQVGYDGGVGIAVFTVTAHPTIGERDQVETLVVPQLAIILTQQVMPSL